MKKIQSVLFFSMTIFILAFYHTSNAMMVFGCPEGKSPVQEEMKCMTEHEKIIAKQEREERARIDKIQVEEQVQIFKIQQEKKIAAQAEADRILRERIAEKIRKENEYQSKIKELEDRLSKLEAQQSISEAEVALKKIQADIVILNKNKNRQILEKLEPKNIKVNSIIPNEKTIITSSSSATSTIVIPQPHQEKIGWFKELLNKFNWFTKK